MAHSVYTGIPILTHKLHVFSSSLYLSQYVCLWHKEYCGRERIRDDGNLKKSSGQHTYSLHNGYTHITHSARAYIFEKRAYVRDSICISGEEKEKANMMRRPGFARQAAGLNGRPVICVCVSMVYHMWGNYRILQFYAKSRAKAILVKRNVDSIVTRRGVNMENCRGFVFVYLSLILFKWCGKCKCGFCGVEWDIGESWSYVHLLSNAFIGRENKQVKFFKENIFRNCWEGSWLNSLPIRLVKPIANPDQSQSIYVQRTKLRSLIHCWKYTQSINHYAGFAHQHYPSETCSPLFCVWLLGISQ